MFHRLLNDVNVISAQVYNLESAEPTLSDELVVPQEQRATISVLDDIDIPQIEPSSDSSYLDGFQSVLELSSLPPATVSPTYPANGLRLAGDLLDIEYSSNLRYGNFSPFTVEPNEEVIGMTDENEISLRPWEIFNPGEPNSITDGGSLTHMEDRRHVTYN